MFEVGGEPFYSLFFFPLEITFTSPHLLCHPKIQKMNRHKHQRPEPSTRASTQKTKQAYSSANHAGHAKDGVVSVSHRHGQHTEKSYTRTCQNMCPLCHRVLYRVVSFSDQYASPKKTINLSPYT